eukprot:SAG31_NODE_4872_length_2894_cov_1.862612_3_plen_167_part_00
MSTLTLATPQSATPLQNANNVVVALCNTRCLWRHTRASFASSSTSKVEHSFVRTQLCRVVVTVSPSKGQCPRPQCCRTTRIAGMRCPIATALSAHHFGTGTRRSNVVDRSTHRPLFHAYQPTHKPLGDGPLCVRVDTAPSQAMNEFDRKGNCDCDNTDAYCTSEQR